MTNYTRRTLLKSAVAAPFAASMGCKSAKKQFSVILHGMVGVQVLDTGLLVLVPEVSGHTDGYGTFRGEEGMMRNACYKLIGVDPGKKPSPDAQEDAVISLSTVKRNVVRANAYCTIELPFPKKLERLRVVSKDGNPFFKTGNAGIPAPDPNQLPLVYGLVYTWSTETPQWTDSVCSPSLRASTLPAKIPNQHIWAAPSFRMPASHGTDAMTAFDGLFDQSLPFDVTNLVHATPDPHGIPGDIADDEVKSIAEQRSPGSPAGNQAEEKRNDNAQNCWVIFITP